VQCAADKAISKRTPPKLSYGFPSLLLVSFNRARGGRAGGTKARASRKYVCHEKFLVFVWRRWSAIRQCRGILTPALQDEKEQFKRELLHKEIALSQAAAIADTSKSFARCGCFSAWFRAK
jgi:hypothetical protein